LHLDFKARYAQRGRNLVTGLAMCDMDADDLHAVIGFLLEHTLEHTAADIRILLAQQAPLGVPSADPPKNDGLFEG